ncbi:DUF4011 domain-containing anti-phage protein Hhe [Agarivorans litoreus]|uniref:DUF4011 domain-containing anti-phage protein Hhe n=1 Tax=Agarivorans litoreus TaxID=1510455 RepID=UPI001C7D0E55|nr:DUF4011 domain-containing anti-phage protein Hhe [Agarivorans litoreus]
MSKPRLGELRRDIVELLKQTPRLKAKEIASKLRCLHGYEVDRTAANSLLYELKSSSLATIDSDYRWQLSSIIVPNSTPATVDVSPPTPPVVPSAQVVRSTKSEPPNNDKVEDSPMANDSFAFDSLEAVRKKLLDLSGRNTLLNYRHPKANCVRFIDELPDQVTELLRSEKVVTLLPVPEPTEQQLIKAGYIQKDPETGEMVTKDFPTAVQWAKYLGINTSYDLPEKQVAEELQAGHQDNNLQTLLYNGELEPRLRGLRSKAHTAIEESGANILYFNIGFLEWKESRDSDVVRTAPLFTIPVMLERTTRPNSHGAYTYTIAIKDDSMLNNFTLKEKLQHDFGIALPEIEENTTPEEYFERIQDTVLQRYPEWRIRRQASLVLLNFTKQAMYMDLDPSNWPKDKNITDHPIVKQFFSAGEESSGGAAYATEHNIDQISTIHDDFPIIYEADSSQHSALIDAVEGKNLVIEGPPGTGKSQTITNLIAAAIASGKRVLFVAEKMAALNVVKDKLDKVGLGEFCLELHSHKTNKLKIFDELGTRLGRQQSYTKPAELEADISRYESLKSHLLEHAELVNSHWKNTERSIHQILVGATHYREKLGIDPDSVNISDINGERLSIVLQKEIADHANMLKGIYDQVSEQAADGNIHSHYWYGVNNTELLGFQTDDFKQALQQFNQSLQDLQVMLAEKLAGIAVQPEHVLKLEQVQQLSGMLNKLPELGESTPLQAIPDLFEADESLVDTLTRYQSIHQQNQQIAQALREEAVDQTNTTAQLEQSLKQFSDFGVNSSTELAKLSASVVTTESFSQTLAELDEALEAVSAGLPSSLAACHKLDANGLAELSKLVELIQLLPNELWRYRGELYDNADLDPSIEQLSGLLEDAKPSHDKLEEQFSLHRLPSSEELGRIKATVEAGGFFSFLSSDWRQAKKALLALAASPKAKLKSLQPLLADLLSYSQTTEKMQSLCEQEPELAELYRGVDTPIERITALRSWYLAVRKEYGIGFGKRVEMGSALLGLERNFAISFKDYAEKEISPRLESIKALKLGLAHLYTKQDYLGEQSPSADSNAPLLADSANQHLQQLNTALAQLEPLASSTEVTLEELSQASKALAQRQISIDTWNASALPKLLHKHLPLSLKAGEFSAEQLAVAEQLHCIVEAMKPSVALASALTQAPSSSTYQQLRALAMPLSAQLQQISEREGHFQQLGRVNLDEWQQSTDGSIDSLTERNQQALSNPKWLDTWLDYIQLRARLSNDGLSQLIKQVECGLIATEQLSDVVELAINHQLAKEIFAEHSGIAQFNGMEQQERRKAFRSYDKKIQSLQQQLVAYKASRTTVPAGVKSGRVGSYSELGLIEHNLGLQRPRIAVRQLLKRSGAAIQALKPCFMMSPMSVAQYLEPGQFDFDLVVMDEASQIRPEDALGAIARGNSIVVVGDPKQLPPTSFFQKAVDNEDDEDIVALEAAESILETAIPMFTNRRLRWHYRSRHESLISFSNHKFYDSNLVLFPSPYSESDEFGIRFTKVSKGRFEGRRNVAEAKAVAAAAAKQMHTSPEESLGIVAMNSEQSDEIERQLELLIKENPEYQLAYERNLNSADPLFVKNLENVQGDERDVIIISMTYGPQTAGATSMAQRFGPINSNDGWRRLNVLFTRSKKRMAIFSSMDSGHVRTSENSKRGVMALKAFLSYCETGQLEHFAHTGKAADSDFELAVMDMLAEHGYECEPQLGVTGYFLDIAVKDPGMPGRYLMGIECDGASYHSAKSVRDRDRLRQEVLEGLNWRIRRIWSTDWFKNPQAQLQPILSELAKLSTPIQAAESKASDNAQSTSAETEAQATSAPEQQVELDLDDTTTEDDLLEKNLQQVDISQAYSAPAEGIDLRQVLEGFNQQVIRAELPKGDISKGLLRPAMLEALLDAQPCSKAEFVECIPEYLRLATHKSEGKYLDQVLELIEEHA